MVIYSSVSAIKMKVMKVLVLWISILFLGLSRGIQFQDTQSSSSCLLTMGETDRQISMTGHYITDRQKHGRKISNPSWRNTSQLPLRRRHQCKRGKRSSETRLERNKRCVRPFNHINHPFETRCGKSRILDDMQRRF